MYKRYSISDRLEYQPLTIAGRAKIWIAVQTANAREALDKYETIIICLYLFSCLMLETHKTRIDTPKKPK